MNDTETKLSIQEQIRHKGEQVVLHLEKHVAKSHFRYFLAKGENGEGTYYSIYAEFQNAEHHTQGSIPVFSDCRETAEGFCRLLCKNLATPLSLSAIYEDSLTP